MVPNQESLADLEGPADESARLDEPEGEDRLRLAVDGARDFAVLLLDRDGRVTSFNAGAERMLGYTAAEILGEPFARLFAPMDVAAGRPETLLRTALARGSATGDEPLVRKDGRRLVASGTTTVLRDEAGRVRGFAQTIRDLADRRGLEEDLRRRVEELTAADHGKSELLALLAHEFRGPLALLKNASKLLVDPRTDETARGETVEMVGRQVARMSAVLDDLLDLSRTLRGEIRLDRQRIELHDVIQEAVETVRPQLAANRQEVYFERARDPVPLDADGPRLRQLFGKILAHASRQSPMGSRIRVVAERTPERGGEEASVRVIDEGFGFEAETLAHLFDAFVEPGSSACGSASGVHVGLAIAKHVVELHGGTIAARSEGRGRGSEIVVHLPVPKPAEPARGPSAPENARSGLRRILVVDDNVDGAKLLATLLRVTGHDVRHVYSGPECLALVEDFEPQAVLLDLGLPGMDGFEVARHLRRRPGADAVLLIALSGYGRDEDRRKTREAGFDHHFVKPADLEAIQRLLALPYAGAEPDDRARDDRAFMNARSRGRADTWFHRSDRAPPPFRRARTPVTLLPRPRSPGCPGARRPRCSVTTSSPIPSTGRSSSPRCSRSSAAISACACRSNGPASTARSPTPSTR
jgi:PAS domain S-box-containing protein